MHNDGSVRRVITYNFDINERIPTYSTGEPVLTRETKDVEFHTTTENITRMEAQQEDY